MGSIKQLASQTFIYGLSSIVGRLLNYLLVPFYTRVFSTDEYGTVTEMYTYVTFLMIFFLPTEWRQAFLNSQKPKTTKINSIPPPFFRY